MARAPLPPTLGLQVKSAGGRGASGVALDVAFVCACISRTTRGVTPAAGQTAPIRGRAAEAPCYVSILCNHLFMSFSYASMWTLRTLVSVVIANFVL